MSEINASIVLQPISANIVVQENNIDITPEDISLQIFAGGYATPSGNVNEVQFNNGGVLAGNPGLKYYPANTTLVANNSVLGQATASNLYANSGTIGAANITGTQATLTGNVNAAYFLGNGALLSGISPNTIFNGNSNVSVEANSNVTVSVGGNANILTVTDTGVNVAGYLNTGDASNLIITGGNNGYFLQTDGTGNLTWAASAGNVTGNGVPGGANTQIQFNDAGNFGGAAGFTFDNTSNLFSAPGDANITGNVTANLFIGNLNGSSNIANTVSNNAQPNITSVGTLTGLNVNGNITAANITANTGVFTGNGSGLSAIAGGNVTGQVANALRAGTVYTNAQPNITSVGTLTSLNVSGNVSAGNVSGTLITGTLTTAAQPNITSVGTLTSLAVTGNISAGNINGGNLITANYITGNLPIIKNGTTNVSIPVTNGNIEFYVAGNLIANLSTTGILTIDQIYVTNASNVNPGMTVNGELQVQGGDIDAKANILSDGQLRLSIANGTPPITVNSTDRVVNFNADLLDGYHANANSVANTIVVRDANASITANRVTATLIGSANTAGTVTTNAQPNITSVGNLTSLTVTGAITSGSANITGNLRSGNANLGNLALANYFQGDGGLLSNIIVGSNVNYIENGNSNVLVTANSNVNVTIAGIANVLTIGSTKLFTETQIESNVSTGTAPFIVKSNTQVANLNVANAGHSITSNTVVNSAQSNITSVGTLTGLTVNGTTNLGNIGNVKITGGTANYVLKTDGTGNLSWTSPSPSPGGSNTYVQFNDAGVLNGVVGLTYNKVDSNLTVSGNIIAQTYFIFTVATGISAAGSVQGNATPLTKQFNEVTTVNTGQGIRLPVARPGSSIFIVNTSANTVNVYPAASAQIDTLGTNNAFSQSANTRIQYFATGDFQWYTFTSA